MKAAKQAIPNPVMSTLSVLNPLKRIRNLWSALQSLPGLLVILLYCRLLPPETDADYDHYQEI